MIKPALFCQKMSVEAASDTGYSSTSDELESQLEKDFCSPYLEKGRAQEYLKQIGDVVTKHSGAQIQIKKYKFRVGSLKDTSYKKELYLLEEWEQFYLPDEMKMEVIGVLENFPCSADSAELVLMVCEDGKVFAYEDDCLHLVAVNLGKMFEVGVQFPGRKNYYRGQSFEDMTDEDWDRVEKSPEVMEVHKQHQKTVESITPTLLENLRKIEQRQREKGGKELYQAA